MCWYLAVLCFVIASKAGAVESASRSAFCS